MLKRFILFTLTITNFGAIISAATNTTYCNRSCGGKTVNFPFGFSNGCHFRLGCSPNGDINFHGVQIRNISSSHLLLNLTASCDRSIDNIRHWFGPTYALTSRNGLLLRNCSKPLNGCVVPSTMLATRFGSGCGGGGSESMSCYASVDKSSILSYDRVIGTGCKVLFSSIVVDDDGSSSVSGSVSGGGRLFSDIFVEFQAIEVEWWINGTCRCHKNAGCIHVGDSGYRCRCLEGFSGDGYHDGLGCRNVSNSHTSELGFYRENKLTILVGGVVAGAASLVILAFICYFCVRRSTYSKSHTSARRLISEAVGPTPVPFYPYREIERATNGFSEKQKLGTGAYGTVYAGILHNDECVAIKKIKHRDTNSIDQVINEVNLLSSVSHPNLVRLLGCCIENGEQILVYEYMSNGTLSQHLQRERGNGLPWTVRLNIAIETAQAIAYLHSARKPPIYHRDIKSSNILLDFNFRSKVADFGLSRIGMMETSHISTAPQGTPGYVDPQYHQNFHLSDKSDVYSFGVVLVEIITAMKVVDFNRPHTDVNLAALAVDRIGKGHVDEIIDPFIEVHRDAWTLSSVHKVAELAFRCLAYHGDMRPSMMEVAHELEQIRQNGWALMEENICMESVITSTCSSPFHGSERSMIGVSSKKALSSRRLVIPHKAFDHLALLEEVKGCSPVSVHDPWLSEQSSPSTNSLLGNALSVIPNVIPTGT